MEGGEKELRALKARVSPAVVSNCVAWADRTCLFARSWRIMETRRGVTGARQREGEDGAVSALQRGIGGVRQPWLRYFSHQVSLGELSRRKGFELLLHDEDGGVGAELVRHDLARKGKRVCECIFGRRRHCAFEPKGLRGCRKRGERTRSSLRTSALESGLK